MKFKKWFVSQFGKRPRNIHVSDCDLQRRINSGYAAQNELEARILYDEMSKSALYAWQIKDEDKA